MDQKETDRAVELVQRWNVFRPAIEAGFSPAQVKELIVSVLEPYFRSRDELAEHAVDVLAGEAFRVIRIKQNARQAKALDHVYRTYRAAESVDALSSYRGCGESERAILAAQSDHWSLFYLELEKADLPIEEFRHEVFRNVGALIESFLFPHLRELLVQVRISRGKPTTLSQILPLKLGNVTNELYETLGFRDLLSPAPWRIRLNQWRNIAQHPSDRRARELHFCVLWRSGE